MSVPKTTSTIGISKSNDLQGHNELKLDRSPRKKRGCCGCLFSIFIPTILIVLTTLYIYFFALGRPTNILILGLDSRNQSSMGRSDTVIMTTYKSSPPYVGMLSVPRDLWVEIPGRGFNRINTANFFAEIENPGTGPSLAIDTIRHNFGVEMDYYIRVDFLGFLELIDLLGGIVIELPTPMAGYDTGPNHLNGEQALAFVRDRQNGDDFSRMEQGQILIRGLLNRSLDPQIWVRLPEILPILQQNLETNLPFWRWPQLAFVILRVGSNNIDARTIDHDMVNPFTTEGGAYVLAPQWDRINPIILEMFGQ